MEFIGHQVTRSPARLLRSAGSSPGWPTPPRHERHIAIAPVPDRSRNPGQQEDDGRLAIDQRQRDRVVVIELFAAMRWVTSPSESVAPAMMMPVLAPAPTGELRRVSCRVASAEVPRMAAGRLTRGDLVTSIWDHDRQAEIREFSGRGARVDSASPISVWLRQFGLTQPPGQNLGHDKIIAGHGVP